MTVDDLRRWGRAFLKPLEQLDALNRVEASILSQEVDQLLCAALSCSFTKLVMMGSRPVAVEDQTAFHAMLERRLGLEPIAYIIGSVGFHAIELGVSPAVLIPRPETELLVERALEKFHSDSIMPSVFDIGSGSGAIILAIASALREKFGVEYIKRGRFIGIDLSVDAIRVARQNAEQLGLEQIVSFQVGNLAEQLNDYSMGQPEVIAANLPYIPESERLPDAVQRFEPVLALRGGATGMDLLFRLFDQVSVRIREGSILLLEIGFEQFSELDSRVQRNGFQASSVYDLHGVPRIAEVVA